MEITLQLLTDLCKSCTSAESEVTQYESDLSEHEVRLGELNEAIRKLSDGCESARKKLLERRIEIGRYLNEVKEEDLYKDLVPEGTMSALYAELGVDRRRAAEWMSAAKAVSKGKAPASRKAPNRSSARGKGASGSKDHQQHEHTAESPQHESPVSQAVEVVAPAKAQATRQVKEVLLSSKPQEKDPAQPVKAAHPFNSFWDSVSAAIRFLPQDQVLRGLDAVLRCFKEAFPEKSEMLLLTVESFLQDNGLHGNSEPAVIQAQESSVVASKEMSVPEAVRAVSEIRDTFSEKRQKSFDAGVRKLLSAGDGVMDTSIPCKSYLPAYSDEIDALSCATKEFAYRHRQLMKMKYSVITDRDNRDEIQEFTNVVRKGLVDLEKKAGIGVGSCGRLFSLFPDEIDTESFRASWYGYLDVLRRKGRGPDEKWQIEKLNALSHLGVEVATQCVEEAAMKGYWKIPGVDFELKELNGRKVDGLSKYAVEYSSLTDQQKRDQDFMLLWKTERSFRGLNSEVPKQNGSVLT